MAQTVSRVGQSDALRIRETCVCLNTRRFTRSMTQRYDEGLASLGLRFAQFSVLAHARALGPSPLGVLADAMDLDQTTLSRSVESLRSEELLTVQKSGRLRVVALTAKGSDVLDRGYPLWQKAQAEAVEMLGGPKEWERLRRTISRASS